ncbi:discoidin domain-containing protein [Azospirillum canadense]|uniref:discoidin domain-containing protein n=1 Tax=Azospirillum canadense TaxID=403962 RepID=UPI0022260F5A|nr:discoidin domain-containing protein [Azospirillum canadense]MCW2243584.1 hypothetical protein [Azospirillum canadense]
MYALERNVVVETTPVAFALAPTSATAGGSGDSAAVNGTSIDVTGFSAGRVESVGFLLGATATLAATKTLTVGAKIQTSNDGASWTDVKDAATILTLTGATGGSAETGVGKIGVSLEYCGRYVRVVATPELSATGADTATIFGTAVFGGAHKKP